jgi:predicted ATP-dependent endonuclease of OLD family
MQNPQATNFEENRKRFDSVQELVRLVTDDSSAELSVTHKQDEILVKFKGQNFFPLASLGSGIEQVVLHAVAATSATNAVVTFEEPELHLHPVLQRQLITYLATKTSNQYFISTHSAHLIDALHADTFHVRLVNGETVIEKAQTMPNATRCATISAIDLPILCRRTA